MYLAKDIRLDRKVALKLLPAQFTQMPIVSAVLCRKPGPLPRSIIPISSLFTILAKAMPGASSS